MTTSTRNTELATTLVFAVAEQLGALVGRSFEILSAAAGEARCRPAGEGSIHVSFRYGFERGEERLHGCVLLPLAEAISLANYLRMASDKEVRQRRTATQLDRTTKEAMLEIANFTGGALSSVVGQRAELGWEVRTEGCQGVRPGVRPALDYEEGTELVVVRARARLHEWPEFELLAILPPLVPAS